MPKYSYDVFNCQEINMHAKQVAQYYYTGVKLVGNTTVGQLGAV